MVTKYAVLFRYEPRDFAFKKILFFESFETRRGVGFGERSEVMGLYPWRFQLTVWERQVDPRKRREKKTNAQLLIKRQLRIILAIFFFLKTCVKDSRKRQA